MTQIQLKLILLIISLLSQVKLSGQNTSWYKINTTPFLLSNSPFLGHSDCYGQPQLGGQPAIFYEHFVTDSFFISNDIKYVKLVLRFFGNLSQIHTNDLSNYSLRDSSDYPSDYYGRIVKYRKVGDSFYLFNFSIVNNHSIESDSIQLYRSLKVYNNKCIDSFPFGDLRNCSKMPTGAIWQVGKPKPKPEPNCYENSPFKKIKNDGKPFTLTIPIQNIAFGSGWPYVELGDYLKSYDPVLNILIKPITGIYEPIKKLWVINYDSDNTVSKGTISIYNGGTDTIFIQKCYTSAGNAIIEGFSPFIAPASWRYLNLSVQHKENSTIPQNPTIMIEFLRKNTKEKKLFYTIPFRIQ